MTRRALADLPLEWATADMIAKLSPGGAGLPERTVALAAFHALPTESNLLFTGYVDLRAAEVERAAPAPTRSRGRSPPARRAAPPKQSERRSSPHAGTNSQPLTQSVAATAARNIFCAWDGWDERRENFGEPGGFFSSSEIGIIIFCLS